MKTNVLTALVVICAFSAIGFSQETCQIRAQVVGAGGEPAGGAQVSLPEYRRKTTTGADGRFEFAGLAAGSYLVNVSSERFGGVALRIEAKSEPDEDLIITLDKLVHSGVISVTAAGVAQGLGEVVNPVSVLEGDDLQLRKQSSLGETLAQQPGVSSTSYGQASSRPVIRGLGQDRIRILENGLDTGDVSSVGPDHAVAADPLVAERIEVVRGPATVLWGANAIGGVVNVLDGRVPDRPVNELLTGTAEIEFGSNSNKKSIAAKLDGGRGHWAWHVDAFARNQDDYESPAPRINEQEHDEEHHETELD